MRALRRRHGLLPGAAGRFAQAAAGSGSRPAPPGRAARACGAPRPAPLHPPRCATGLKLEAAEPGRLHLRQAHRGGGGDAAPASGEGEAAPARPNADHGGRPHPEQQEDIWCRRRARQSKVAVGGWARGPGRAAARALARLASARRMGSRLSVLPPGACSPVGYPNRGAASVRQLGHRISVGWLPGRSH